MRSFRIVPILALILLCATLVLNAQTRVRGPRPAAVPPGAPAEATTSEPTRFQCEFFQVTCDPKELANMNVESLGKDNPSPAELLKRLNAFGDASLSVRICNVLDLTRSSLLTEGTRVPTVQGMNVSSEGKQIPSVTYNAVGASVRVQGNWDAERQPDTAHVHCTLELSSIGSTAVELGDGVRLPEFRQFKVEQELDLENGTPVLLVSNSQPAPSYAAAAASKEQPAKCTVTVVRVMAWKLWESKRPE